MTEQRETIWRLLLAWYAEHGRDLPWRHTRDPYSVLVSEIMLQQTQVERVLPKYHEFLSRFPTLATLATAPASDVIRAWAPLGYNVRAVRLRQIALATMERYGGALPDTLDALLALKGIGRYTAGAVACFAFGLPVATVDTNIRRVLWRVFRGIEPSTWPAGQAATRDALALAEWALPPHAAYDWQQALMDLGATICVSRQPKCERCPLAAHCAALAETARRTLFPSGEALAHLRAASPDAVDAVATTPRRVAEAPAPYDAATKRSRRRAVAQPFTSTSRYFRGRVLAVLRDHTAGTELTLGQLGPRIKPDWAPDDVPWLAGLIGGLARDGLVRVSGAPPADGAASAPDTDGTRISLP